MSLTLTISKGADLLQGQDSVRSVDQGGLTIGRGRGNDWVLPDPNKHLSNQHCAIEYDGGHYLITDTSTNGVYLNDERERMPRDSSMELHDGDRVKLGEYQVVVTIDADDAADAAGPEPFGDSVTNFGLEPPPKALDQDVEDTGPGIFDIEDPPDDSMSPDDGLLDDLQGGIGGKGLSGDFGNVDDLFGGEAEKPDWEPGSQSNHDPAILGAFEPPKIEKFEDTEADDPLAGLDQPFDVSPPTAPPDSTTRERISRPPPQQDSDDDHWGKRAPPEPPPAGDTSGAAYAAFLDAAGLSPADIAAENGEDVMRIVGAAFREMVQGLQEVLRARAEVKIGIGAKATVIGAQRNNPLKILPTADEAMQNLLKGGGGGYLEPVPAVREAFKDVKAHEIAMMASLQKAIDTLLERFDPGTLEKRLTKQSVLDNILPAARKAKYWELYEELYKQIAREAEDDLRRLFGPDIAAAYERQVKRL